MKHQTNFISIPLRPAALLLVALLLLLLSPTAQIAHADSNGGWEEHIELTGDFDGTFTLDSNTHQIFQATDVVPGDSWSGTITFRNRAEDPMEISLRSITSDLDDLALYNALTLDIQTDNTEIYSGSYGNTLNPITPYYMLSSGETMTLNVRVEFPAHYGNEMIGKQMNSTWTFDARYSELRSEPVKQPSDAPSDPSSEPSETLSDAPSEKPSGKPTVTQTGNDIGQSTTTTAVYLIVGAFCLLSIVVTWLRIRAEKQRMDD